MEMIFRAYTLGNLSHHQITLGCWVQTEIGFWQLEDSVTLTAIFWSHDQELQEVEVQEQSTVTLVCVLTAWEVSYFEGETTMLAKGNLI